MAVTKSDLVVNVSVQTKDSAKNLSLLSNEVKDLEKASASTSKSTDILAKDLTNLGSSSTKAANDIEKVGDSFEKAGQGASKGAGNFEVFSGGLLKVYAAVELAQTAFHALSAVFESTIGQYAEAQGATLRLGQTLKAMGEKDIVGTTKRFEQLTQAIELQTGADADQILSMIQRGKATGITNDNMEIMVSLASKMSAAFGGTIQDNFDTLYQSTIGMGKGIGLLGADLKALTPEALIAGEGISLLQEKLKGFDANTGTLDQTLAKVKTQFGNLAEATGKFLLEGLHVDVLLAGLVRALTAATNFMEKFNEAISEANLNLTDMAVLLGPIAAGFAVIFGAQVLKTVTSLVGLVRGLSAGFLLLSLKVIVVAGAVLALLAAVEFLFNNFRKLGDAGLLAFDYIKLGIAKLTGNGGEVIALTKEIDQLKKGLDFGVTGEAIGKLGSIFGKLTSDTDGAGKSTDKLGKALGGLNNKYKAAKIGLTAEEIKKQLDNAAKEIEKYEGFITGLRDRTTAAPVSKEEGVFQQKLKDQKTLDDMIQKSQSESLKLGANAAKVQAKIAEARKAVTTATIAGLQKESTATAAELLALGGELTRLVLDKTDALKNERNEQLALLDAQIIRNDTILNQLTEQVGITGLDQGGERRVEQLEAITKSLKEQNDLRAGEFDLMIRANDALRKKKEYISNIADLKLANEIRGETLEIEKKILELEKQTKEFDSSQTKIRKYKEENRLALEAIDIKYKQIQATIDLENAEKQQAQISTDYLIEKKKGLEDEIKALNESNLAQIAAGKTAKDIAKVNAIGNKKLIEDQRNLVDERIRDVDAINKQKSTTLVNLEDQLKVVDKQIVAQKNLAQAQIDATPRELTDWVDALGESVDRAFGKDNVDSFFKEIGDGISRFSGSVIDIFVVRHVEEINTSAGGITDQKATDDKNYNAFVTGISNTMSDSFNIGKKTADIIGNSAGVLGKSLSNTAGFIGSAIDFVMNAGSYLEKAIAIPEALLQVMLQLPSLLAKFISAFPAQISKIAEALPSVMFALVGQIPQFLDAMLASLPVLFERIAEMLPEIFIKLLGMLPKLVIAIVKSVFKVIQSVIKGLLRGISNAMKGKKMPRDQEIQAAQAAIPKEAVAKLSGQSDRLFSVKDLSDKAASGTEKIEQVIEESNDKADKKRLSTWALIGKGLTAMWTGMGVLLSDIWKKLWGGFSKVWEIVVGGTVKALGAIATALGNVIGMIWKALGDVAGIFVNAIKDVFDWLEHPEKFFQALKDIWMTVLDLFTRMWDGLAAIFQVPIDAFNMLFNGIGKLLEGIFGGLGDSVNKGFEGVTNLFANLEESLKEAFAFLPEFFQGMWNALTQVFDGLSGIVDKAFQSVRDIFSGLASAVSGAFQFVKDIFDGLAEGVKTAFQFVKDIFDGMAAVVTTAFEGIKAIGTAIWDGFKEGLEGATDFLKGIGTAIWDGIKGGLAGIGEIFSGVKLPEFTWPEITIPTITIPKITLPSFDLTSLTTKLQDAGKKFASTVSSGLKAPFNLIIDLINSIKFPAFDWSISAGRLGSWSGRFWDEIDIIPGQIARLAKGGPVDGMEPFGTDTVPAMLTPGEFIMSKDSVGAIGINNLRNMNSGKFNGFGGSSVSNNTNTVNIEITIDAKVAMDKNFIQDKLVPDIKAALKRASLNGEFILSEKGIR